MIPPTRRAALLTTLQMERRVKRLARDSYARWLPIARAAVLPGLTAAAEEPPPPQPEQLALTQAAWEEILAAVFLPGMAAILWEQLTAEMTNLGITATEVIRLASEAAASSGLPGTTPGGDEPDTDDQPGAGESDSAPAHPPRGAQERAEPRRDDEDGPLTPELVARIPSVQEWVEAYLAAVNNRMVRTPDTAFRLIADDLREAVAEGESIPQQGERIARILDAENLETFGGRRPALVARTETAGALNAARLESARVQAEITGEVLHKVWLATIDNRTRATHFAVDGQRVPSLDGEFELPNGVKMRWPGEPGAPASEVCNCVAGSTLVEWPGQQVSGATRRRHTGTFVDLTTERGHVLTITPNHPVLTPAGYVPAGLLRPGDQVLATRAPVVDSPEKADVPARIEELHRAMGNAGVQQWMVAGRVDFHGDATEGEEIEIVWAHRELGLNIHTEFGGDLGEDALIRRGDTEVSVAHLGGLARPSDADRTDGDLALSSVPPGLVGRSGKPAPFVLTHASEPDPVGFAAAAAGQPEFVDAAVDESSADSEVLRHLEHAHAAGMEPCQLVEVQVYPGSHDVFNLSTSDHWYTGNGIAVHNCRCALMILAEDEEIPAEDDRQTERGPGDANVRNRAGSRQDEIDRRREEDGIVRARDDPDGVGQINAAAPPPERIPAMQTFTAVLAHLGVATDDGRYLDPDMDLRFRDTPLPLRWQRQAVEQHGEAFTVAAIDTIGIEGTQIVASGHLLDTAEAAEAALQIREGVTAPSIDLADVEWEIRDEKGRPIEDLDDIDEDSKLLAVMTSGIVTAATLVSIPAFGNTSITLDDVDADVLAAAEYQQRDHELLVAAATAPRFRPSGTMFADPGFTEPTPLHMTDDGRIVGHLATFGTCHVGIADRCVTPPRSVTGYAHFHTSAITLDDGVRLPVGRLTVGAGHAGHGLSPRAAAEHYDTLCTTWAYVRAGEDAFGPWVSGVPHPDATEEQIRDGLSAPLSGDWRNIGGNLELVAALSVNTPGFPVLRGREDEYGRPQVLVASLAPRYRRQDAEDKRLRAVAREAVREYNLDAARRTAAHAIIARRRRAQARDLIAALNNRKG